MPFNYVVVATALSPNGRNFPTVISGAVFDSNLSSTLDCNLNLNSIGEAAEAFAFSAVDVATEQIGNDTFQYSFETESNDGESSVTVSGSVAYSGEDASSATGLITYTLNGDEESTSTISLSGTLSYGDGDSLSAMELSSEDGTVQLSCS